MQHEIRYQPSYSLAILRLDPGEEVRCESGAMVSMSAELVLETKMNSGNEGGGLFRSALGALKRSVLADESFFITTVRANSRAGELTLAPATPGDIQAVELDGAGLMLQSGSYLASSPGVNVDTAASLRGVLGGEGAFFLHLTGRGLAFLTSFGAIHRRVLAVDERYVVDSGHLVAFTEGTAMETRMAVQGGGFFKRAMTSAASGEGMVMEFTGPGEVWLQTRNAEAFSSWLYKLLPKPTNNSSG
jgi:uncharacterized protein (TIGR00266 family)